MAFNQLNQIVTPSGTAVYPHLRSTEVFEGNDTGKYTCGIKLSKEDTDKLIERIEREWESAKNSNELADKRYGRNSQPTLGFHEDKNGDIVFKAKTNAVIKTKTGDIIEKDVAVFDKYGKPMEKDVEIGNGSTIQLCILLRPFYASSTIYGVQLLLKAVRVVNFVPAGSGVVSAADCGFECEQAPAQDFPDDPFIDNGADF